MPPTVTLLSGRWRVRRRGSGRRDPTRSSARVSSPHDCPYPRTRRCSARARRSSPARAAHRRARADIHRDLVHRARAQPDPSFHRASRARRVRVRTSARPTCRARRPTPHRRPDSRVRRPAHAVRRSPHTRSSRCPRSERSQVPRESPPAMRLPRHRRPTRGSRRTRCRSILREPPPRKLGRRPPPQPRSRPACGVRAPYEARPGSRRPRHRPQASSALAPGPSAEPAATPFSDTVARVVVPPASTPTAITSLIEGFFRTDQGE